MSRFLIVATTLRVISALRTTSSSGSASAAEKLVHMQCEDSQMLEDLGPIVGSVSSFFGKRPKTMVYPWALTMLGATRYGGASILDRSKGQNMIDHDLDFLVQMPNTTLKDARLVVKAWQDNLKETTGLNTFDNSKAADEVIGKVGQENHPLNRLNVHHFWIMVNKKSGVARKLATDDFAGRFYDKMHESWSVPASVGPFATTAIKKAESFFQEKKKNAFIQNAKGMLQGGVWTMVDLWVKREPLDSEFYGASTTQKTLFMGHEFPFPKDASVIYQDILSTYQKGHRIWKRARSYCDLAEPKGLFEEDVQASPEMSQLTKTCAGVLDGMGYASMKHCF